MENDLLLGYRNIMLFSIMFAAGALLPEGIMDIRAAIIKKWKRYKEQRIYKKREQANEAQEKFWEIDMTKIEL